jgi:uncharacterized protein with HEPN domain
MSRHDPVTVLQQIVESCEEVAILLEGADHPALAENRLLELAVLRLLEMIGEAVTRLPEDLRNRYSEIPWGEVVGLRNRLIHGYDSVDLEIVERIVAEDLPDLLQQVREISA